MRTTATSHAVRKAVFLDRDGVIVPDEHLFKSPEEVRLFPYVPEAFAELGAAGLPIVVVTNQAVVARGLASEQAVEDVHKKIQQLLATAGGGTVERFYFCPHHPSATLTKYRVRCDCRKPKPGMLHRAADELGIDLPSSWMVGDRLTDIMAGHRAGCRTVLVETGMHSAPTIELGPGDAISIAPDYRDPDLRRAVHTILTATD